MSKSLVWQSLLLLFHWKEQVMATLQELTTKLDGLQAALDAEQAQIAAAIAALQATVADLQAQIADGATPAQLQTIIDRITAIQTDLEGTVP